MSVLPALESRRAYRAFSEEPVDRKVLHCLVQAAHTAPSSGNNQPWRIITVDDPEQLSVLKETLSGGNYWAKKAPVITAFVTSPTWSMQLGGRDYAWFELGMAAMAYQIQAVAEQLYVHPMAGFSEKDAKQVLGVPEDAVIMTLVAVGYPGEPDGLSEKHLESEQGPRIRKPLEAISAYSTWHDRLVPQKK